MKYFSMFSGIGGFELGSEKAFDIWGKFNYSAECVGYSEIDKYASAIFWHHWPEYRNFGDATKINPNNLPDFGFLMGGFPCQAFSVAGKRGGFSDTRGTLFFEIARILKDKRPRNFLLENVKGLLSHEYGKTVQTMLGILSDLGYATEWMVLNSKDFGVPQNRERIFIVGHLGGFGGREIFPLRDCDKGSDFSHKSPERKGKRVRGDFASVTTRTGAAGAGQHLIVENDLASVDTRTGSTARGQHLIQVGQVKEKDNMSQRVYDSQGISTTIRSQGGGQGTKTGLYAIKGDLLSRKNPKRQCGIDGESMFTLRGAVTHGIIENFRLRRLTPTECERLQGFPDGWTEYGVIDGKKVRVSDSQRYKCLGNAVTVNVIGAIITEMLRKGFWDG